MSGHEHEGHRQRMRMRFMQGGLDGFAPHEALELLLFFAIPRRDVNPLAHRLIDHFGTVEAVLAAGPEQLMQVPGIGEGAAALLSLVPALSRFALRERQARRAVIKTYGQSKEYCAHLFEGKAEEVLFVICLDAQGRVLRAVPAITGTIDEIAIYPRTIVACALRHNAHTVLLAHNHPSGAAEPSQADIHSTALLRDALAAVDIALLDHVIYADGACVSMGQWTQGEQVIPMEEKGHSRQAAADARAGRAQSAREMHETDKE